MGKKKELPKNWMNQNLSFFDLHFIDKDINLKEATASNNHIYFLLNVYNEIVYIGVSRKPYQRIEAHKKDKEFRRSFIYHPVVQETIFDDFNVYDLEAELIRHYRPRYNISIPGDRSGCRGYDRDMLFKEFGIILGECRGEINYG